MTNLGIRFEKIAGAHAEFGVIVLDRPDALNALSYPMLDAMLQQLSQWQLDSSVQAVIIKSACDRAFCAGGDIRSMYDNRDQDAQKKSAYFAKEYCLNRLIHDFPKPYIALLDGVTMGGGVGISLHGSHTVATENVKWAMPETKIGFFPDVGASYHLARCPEMVGWYLVLSARSIDADTAFDANLVNHVIKQKDLVALEQALLDIQWNDNPHECVTHTIASFSSVPECTVLSEYYPYIRRCFSQNTVEEVCQSLEFEGTAWCDALREEILQRSPLSLKVAFEQLHHAVNMDFDQVIQQDFTLVQHFVDDHDFFEGIRALIVNKDNAPIWQPGQLEQVDSQRVKAYFQPQSYAQTLF